MKILVFDTAIGSGNLGDQIIMEAVYAEIATLFPQAFVFSVPTHSQIGKYGRRLAKQADLIVVGGTNLLFSHWSRNRQWALEYADLGAVNRKLVLMGTGWTAYQSPPDWRSRHAYNRLLSRSALHSLRDSYSVRYLHGCGFARLANTGCPTLWNLPDPALTPSGVRPDTVITTLTDYRPAPEHDRAMLRALMARYERVLIWIQGSGDLDYVRQLDLPGWEPIDPSLRAFDRVLEADRPVDYVGTRLHGGIRALQKRRRALILSVDNRAKEMGRDFNLPIIERGQIDALNGYLDEWPALQIKLPKEAISAWRDQFALSQRTAA